MGGSNSYRREKGEKSFRINRGTVWVNTVSCAVCKLFFIETFWLDGLLYIEECYLWEEQTPPDAVGLY